MQRKELLKGHLYSDRGTLVRVLDTSESPVKVEYYDYVSQSFLPGKSHPRDLSDVRGYDEVEVAASRKAAHELRQLFAQIEVFNARHGAENSIAETSAGRVQTSPRVNGASKQTVTIGGTAYHLAVHAGVAPVPTTVVRIDGDAFIQFTTSIGIPLQEVDAIKPHPLFSEEELADENINRIIAEREERLRRSTLARDTVNAVTEQVREEIKAERNDDKYVSYVDVKNHPDFRDRARKALAEVGLDEEDYGHF